MYVVFLFIFTNEVWSLCFLRSLTFLFLSLPLPLSFALVLSLYVALSLSLSLLLDVDECVEGLSSCGAHGQCVNLPGSHRCQCQSGYEFGFDGRTCLGQFISMVYRKAHQTCCFKLHV